MDQAVQYTQSLDKFVTLLTQQVGPAEVLNGRRFARIAIGGSVQYFIDKASQDIFGAKSAFQFNSRRQYGSLKFVDQWDWKTQTPLPGTEQERDYHAREEGIVATYRKRGRPRKTVTTP